MVTLQFILVFLLCATGLYLGCLLTENSRYSLPVLFPRLNMKPFNCRPCLTFHITWILFAIAAIILHSVTLFSIGVVCAFIIFGILYIHNKYKIEK